jgi:hypothetical protein
MATKFGVGGQRVIGDALKKRREYFPVGSGDSFPAIDGFSKHLQQRVTSRVDISSPSVVAVWKKKFGIGKRLESINFTSK